MEVKILQQLGMRNPYRSVIHRVPGIKHGRKKKRPSGDTESGLGRRLKASLTISSVAHLSAFAFTGIGRFEHIFNTRQEVAE